MKMEAGKIRMMLERKYLNGLCTLLDEIAKDNDDNEFTNFSKQMLKKIQKHGRKFNDKFDNEKVIIYLYNNEAELLLRLLPMCLTAALGKTNDYYDNIGIKKEEHRNSAEKKLNDVFV